VIETYRSLDQLCDHLVVTATHVIVGPLRYVKSDGRECIQWLVTITVSDQHNDLVVPPGIDPSGFRNMLLAELGMRGSLTVQMPSPITEQPSSRWQTCGRLRSTPKFTVMTDCLV
jgi:hypothetical protein